jgi:type IV secretory pathway VirJ component
MLKNIFVSGFILLSIHLFAAKHDTISFGEFGKIVMYIPDHNPKSLVLFVSGDGGWEPKTAIMAENIVVMDALVAGIDILKYYKNLKRSAEKCYYPSGDLEELSIMLQKKYKIEQYVKPILVGYSSGATLVYGALAQAPANTFKGAISLGFCPDIEIDRPLCNGTGLSQHVISEGKSYYLEQCKVLTAPFFVLQGKDDLLCLHSVVEEYMKNFNMGELISLPKVGHGFADKNYWLPQFTTAYNSILTAPSYVEMKAQQNKVLQSQHIEPLSGNFPITLTPTAIQDTLPMAFFISGDGGWTSFDQSVCDFLAEKGIPVVGLDAQKYFWNVKTPEETAIEISKAVEHFLKQWNKNSFILIGYSFGACVAPFVAYRLPADLKFALHGVYLLSPDEKGDFEIHLSDMLSIGNSKDSYDVLAETKKIKHFHSVCLFGSEEDKNLDKHFTEAGAKVFILPGSHNYNNNAKGVAETIFNSIR